MEEKRILAKYPQGKNINKYIKYLLFGLLIFASFYISLSSLNSGITFGYDQSRDAFEALSIWKNHDLKIMGPTSDIPKVNHGVIWYYYLAIAYGIGQGVPENAALFSLLVQFLTLPLVFFVTWKISKKSDIAIVTTIIYSLSPLFTSFNHWLSNPILALLFTPALLYFLWKYIHRQELLTAGLIGLLFGLLVQSDIAFLILGATFLLYFYFYKLKFKIVHFLIFCITFLIGISTIILTFIKFKTNIIFILSDFITNNTSSGFSLSDSLLSLLDSGINFLTLTFLPFPALMAFCLVVIFILAFKKKLVPNDIEKFLLIWLFGIIFIFIFNHGSLAITFLFSPFLFAGAFLISLYLSKIKSDHIKYASLFAIILFQILQTKKWTTNDNNILSVQRGMYTKYEQQVVDYIYQDSKGEKFGINTVTNPLFIDVTWGYLFRIYGENKYGYLPVWSGRSQVGYLGEFPETNNFIDTRYLIIEPKEGIDEKWIAKIEYDEDKLSSVIDEKKFGKFVVQKRVFVPNKKAPKIPPIIQNEEKVIKF